jgi:hypothetical protein
MRKAPPVQNAFTVLAQLGTACVRDESADVMRPGHTARQRPIQYIHLQPSRPDPLPALSTSAGTLNERVLPELRLADGDAIELNAACSGRRTV